MKKHLWWIALVLVGLGVGGVFGLRAWRSHVRQQADDRSFRRAEQALKESRAIEALGLFQAADRTGSPHPWPAIEVAALTRLGQLARLVSIHEKAPSRILENEEAALLVARVYLHTRQREKLASITQGRKSSSPAWGMLEADVMMLEGKGNEARKILNGLKYEGTNDIPRLVRLALLSDMRTPMTAWNLLADAAALDSRNPDVRSFRGQLLEQLGKTALARVEYVAALVSSPDPLRRDQLAEFYRRQGSLDLALATWRDGLATNSLDFLWLKTAFWNRMLAPDSGPPVAGNPPAGNLSGLAREIRALPPGHFWSEGLTNEIASHRDVAAGRQELFWLEMAEMLRTRQEAMARDRLHFAKSASVAWAPELARALGQILGWRQATNRTLNPPNLIPASLTTNSHTFFLKLEEASAADRTARRPKTLSPELESVVVGEHAFAAAFLAEGWREAAITVADPEKLDPQAPEWLAYGLGQALRYNRGHAAALRFLGARASTPTLQLLAAEIQLGAGQTNEAYAGLSKLATSGTDAGFRAAWLLATSAVERRDAAAARGYVAGQPQLSEATAGKELLARAAIVEGKSAEADAIYASIAGSSVEARAHLARQAFARKDWKSARRYTEELLAIMPDQLELRANLDAIAAAEGKKP